MKENESADERHLRLSEALSDLEGVTNMFFRHGTLTRDPATIRRITYSRDDFDYGSIIGSDFQKHQEDEVLVMADEDNGDQTSSFLLYRRWMSKWRPKIEVKISYEVIKEEIRVDRSSF